MRWYARLTMVVGVLSLGYVLGRLDAGSALAIGQETPAGPSEEAARKVLAANEALKLAMDALKNESLYVPATRPMNVYGILSGGVNAIDDLEAGRGVDPETFAALYADQAIDEVAQHLSKDSEGRLTYKNKLIRIYPVSRLKKNMSQRQILSGEVQSKAAE